MSHLAFSETDVEADADVIVVGSGAGGASIAVHLARAGVRVLVIEAGAWRAGSDLPSSAYGSMRDLLDNWASNLTMGRAGWPIVQARTVGGTTVINSAICVRTPADVFARWQAETGVGGGLADRVWAHQDALERELSVQEVPAGAFGRSNTLATEAATALGWHDHAMRRYVAGCAGSGQCIQGCRALRKQSVDVVFLPEVRARSGVVWSNAPVDRVVFERGRAVGVRGRFRDPAGRRGGRFVARAPRVVVAASATHGPALLRRSGLRGAVGTGFRAHPGSGVIGLYDDPVDMNTGATQGKNYATVFVRLKDRRDRTRSVRQLTAPVRERLERIAGITITNLGVASTFGNKQIEVSVQGSDQRQLEVLAARAVAEIRSIPGIVDLDTSSKPARPTIAVEIDRAVASDLGVGVAQIGAALRPLVAGEVATTWKAPDDENYDVRIRLPLEGRRGVEDLARLTIASSQLDPEGAPRMVPLRQVARLAPSEGPTQINRKNLAREVTISANVYGAPPGSVGLEVQRRVQTIAVPPGYRFVTGGATRDMQDSFGYALQALLLAVTFIYMILASQFRSFLQPVSIMASLPLSLIGVMLALLAWRSTLNMFSVIGFIMLMGLVTKNAILLIDFANQQRRAGVERTRALLAAAEIRLRPILMTTLAMVFGMLPLAISTGEGAEQRAPMAHAVIGGVIASTLLTLLVVPVLYAILDELVARVRGRPTVEPVESAPPA